MKNNDPVLALIAAAVITLEAVLTLVVAAAALLITLAQWRPAPAPSPAPAAALVLAPVPIEPIPARPQPHPIAALADRLAELNVATLRSMANIHGRRVLKADLIAMVIACG